MTWREPPEGWSTFGTHVDQPGSLVFSDELGEDGLPLWERKDPRECGFMGCGHPRCEPVCAPVSIDDYLRWKEAGKPMDKPWSLYQRRLLTVGGEEKLAYDIGTTDGEKTSVVGANAVDCKKCGAKAPDACKGDNPNKPAPWPHLERTVSMNIEIEKLREERDGA